jgi:protein-tyrosine-phosphatase
MAKALFNKLATDRGLAYHAESAGTQPSDYVHSNVAEAMAKIGVDISRERPQLITNDMIENAEHIFTMGCAVDSDACPAIFLKDVVDWGLSDPAGEPAARVREIREEIAGLIERLADSLG